MPQKVSEHHLFEDSNAIQKPQRKDHLFEVNVSVDYNPPPKPKVEKKFIDHHEKLVAGM